MTAEILNITPAEYHALPHFNVTRAKEMIARSPLHAKHLEEKDPTAEMDRGSVLHSLTLGKGAEFVALPYDDWRTKAAKEARAAARAAGKIPVKAADAEDYLVTSKAIIEQLAEWHIVLDGRSELVIVWDEQTPDGPVKCKAMLDHAWLDRGVIFDLKITEDASPDVVERTAEYMNYAIQAAAYTRALTALRPNLAGRIAFLFGFCEPYTPHAINLCEPDGMFRELGERRWLRAVAKWASCTKHNNWPGYGRRNRLGVPGWALTKEEHAA